MYKKMRLGARELIAEIFRSEHLFLTPRNSIFIHTLLFDVVVLQVNAIGEI